MAIDTSEFEYAESRLMDLYQHLKNKGFDVYMPGIKSGECTSPYVVVKNDGGTKHISFSSNVDLYSIMCYVPKQSYSRLEPFVTSVEKAMKDIVPLFHPQGQKTPSYYDDSVKAHMISIEYKNYKKL